jgi:peptidoglycan-associated lipoprotein
MRLISIVLVVVMLVSGCGVEKKAQKAFVTGKYQNSIDLYKKVLASNPDNGKANYFVGESFRLSNRIKESEQYYAKAGGKGIDKDSVQFFYAQSLKANSKYPEAKKELEQLAARTTNVGIKDRASSEIKALDYLSSLNEKTNYYRTKNLEIINSPAAEYSPVFLNNELYFTSARSNNEKIYEATGTPFTNIYKVNSRGANVDIASLAALPEGINSAGINDGCITFTPDGKTMVFAKGNTAKKKGINATKDVDLFISRFRNGTWTEATPVAGLNDTEAWDSSPFFSPDGKTLYFSSNRKGRGKDQGYGGLDIYSAVMDSRGRFTRVRNLGPQINTAGDELFPYVADDGKLYFASDGHPGYGGLDLFVMKRTNGRTLIENLGQPMNSPGDDFGIFLFKPDRGFFTSNRDGGKGDDDIYTFVNEDPDLKVINYFLQGITYTPGEDLKLQVLPNTKVTLYDEKGEILQDYVTGNDGKFLFRVYENENYNLVAETEGYLVKRQLFSTQGKSIDPLTLKDLITNITLDTAIVLDKIDLNKIFVLENIYYGFNRAEIRDDAAKELDKLVQLLLDNPEIKIELSSHTDSVDDRDYNIDLSQRRAESAVRYLVQRGIAPDRLVAKGYGEDKPIARNTNPDGSDNPDGRQKNRRTEFKILSVSPLPKPIEEEEQFDEDKYFRGD